MCTAYELGKRGGSFPDHLKSEAVDQLLGISGVHLIRPTIPAPVIVMDGSARTMSWGFRRSFAPKLRALAGDAGHRDFPRGQAGRAEKVGELNAFGPSAVALEFSEASNFLKPVRKEDPDFLLRFVPTES